MRISSNQFAAALLLVAFYSTETFGAAVLKEENNVEDFDAETFCQTSEKGYYTAHPFECQKYIICANTGKALEASCEPNYYNIITDKIGECRPAEQVDCGPRKLSESLKPKEEQPSIVVKPPYLANPLPFENEAWREQLNCNGQQNGLYNIPKQCHTFLHCQDGKSYVKVCPNNLIFDELITQRGQVECGYLEDTKRTDCRDVVISDEQRVEQETEEQVYQEVEQEQYRTSKDEAWREQLNCFDQKNGHYNIPNQCHNFLQCQDGISYVKDCPASLVFDELTTDVRGQEACGYLRDVKRTDCRGAVRIPAVTSDDIALQLSGFAKAQAWMYQLPCSGLRDGKHAIPNYCGLYYTCLEGKNLGIQPCHIGTVFETRGGPEGGDCFKGEQISRPDCGQKQYCEKHGAGKHATASNACDRFINCDTNKSVAYELGCPNGGYGTIFEYSNEEQKFDCVHLQRASRTDC